MKVFPFRDALKFRKSHPFLLEGPQAAPFCPFVNCGCELECRFLFYSNARFFSEYLFSLVIIFLPVFILIFVLTNWQTSEAWEPANNNNNNKKRYFGNWRDLIIGNVFIIWFYVFIVEQASEEWVSFHLKWCSFTNWGAFRKKKILLFLVLYGYSGNSSGESCRFRGHIEVSSSIMRLQSSTTSFQSTADYLS